MEEYLFHWEQVPFFGSWFCVGWDDGKSCVACSSGKAAFVTFFRLWYINLQLTRFRWKTIDAQMEQTVYNMKVKYCLNYGTPKLSDYFRRLYKMHTFLYMLGAVYDIMWTCHDIMHVLHYMVRQCHYIMLKQLYMICLVLYIMHVTLNMVTQHYNVI